MTAREMIGWGLVAAGAVTAVLAAWTQPSWELRRCGVTQASRGPETMAIGPSAQISAEVEHLRKPAILLGFLHKNGPRCSNPRSTRGFAHLSLIVCAAE